LKNLSTELDSTITETTDFQNLARTANILYNAFSLNYRGYSSSLIDDTASLPPLVVVPPVAYKYIKEKKILEEVPYTEDDSETSLYMVKPSTSPYPEYIKECIESSFGINSENAPEFQLQIPNKDLQSFFSWFKKKERSFLERFPKVKTATP